MPNPLEIQVAELAADIKRQFESPKIYAGCEVKSVADISLYTSENGWIEALVHEHNQQRIRYRGTPAGVGTADLIDVIYYPNTNQFVSYSAGGTVNNPADNAKVSKLVSPDLSINPVIAADNSGDITAENDMLLGNTARGKIVYNGSIDQKLNDETIGQYFDDNDSSFPAGWTETDAPADSVTNNTYGFWRIRGNSGNAAWKYRINFSVDLEADITGWASFQFGPIVFADRNYSADVDYYFGVYADDGVGAIDEDIFSRIHLQWDSATPQWRVRGESKDGTTQTDGSWFVLSTYPLTQPLFFRAVVRNNAAKTARSYLGAYHDPQSQTQLQNIAPAVANTYGDLWVQMHQTRGSGLVDILLVGNLDFWNSTEIT